MGRRQHSTIDRFELLCDVSAYARLAETLTAPIVSSQSHTVPIERPMYGHSQHDQPGKVSVGGDKLSCIMAVIHRELIANTVCVETLEAGLGGLQ